MGQSKWDEEKIIQTLKEFPEMKDQQTQEELFEKIEQKRASMKQKRRGFRFMPVLAAACVLLIAAIISPAILKNTIFTPGSEQTSPDSGSTSDPSSDKGEKPLEESHPQAMEELPKSENLPPEEGDFHTFTFEGEDLVFYPGIQEVPSDQRVVTLYYPDKSAMGTVPLSTFVDKSKSRVEAIKTAMGKIDPEKYGVGETWLKKVNLSEVPDENTLVVDLEPGSVQGSTGERQFLATIRYTAHELEYDKIKLQTNGEDGYNLSHTGRTTELEATAPEKGVTALLTDTKAFLLTNGIQLNGEKKPGSVKEALQMMKEDFQGFGYEETIQRNVFISNVVEEGDTVVIVFTKGSRLVDDLKHQAMIESMLLTANQFGFEKVQFKNANIDRIGQYDLTKPVPVIKAPNLVTK